MFFLINFSEDTVVQVAHHTATTRAVVGIIGHTYPVSGLEMTVHSVFTRDTWVKLPKPVLLMVRHGSIRSTQKWEGDPPVS